MVCSETYHVKAGEQCSCCELTVCSHCTHLLSPVSLLLLSAAGCAVHKSCSWAQLSLCSAAHLYELPVSHEPGPAHQQKVSLLSFPLASPEMSLGPHGQQLLKDNGIMTVL